MKKSKYSSFDELPLMLNIQEVADVFGIGLAHAYELVKQDGFPSITLGSRIVVPRDKLISWTDAQSKSAET